MKRVSAISLGVVVLFAFLSCSHMAGYRPAPNLGQATPAKADSATCAALSASFRYLDTTVTSASIVVAGSVRVPGITQPMPEHCLVKGKVNERKSPVDGKIYAISFEMRLPTEWSGRFFYQANGGLDGIVAPAYGDILGGAPLSNGLLKGFAVISSDAGHAMEKSPIGGATFGIDPQARIDYGYNAVRQLTPMAKALIKTYYGKLPDKSYIVGTSNGGRHAMVAAARFADQYDGFLAGSPGFNLPKAAVAQLWGAQQYARISKPSADTGRPDITTSFSPANLQLVANSIVKRCDGADGLIDAMVSDTVKCQALFDIDRDVPTCSAAPDGACLTGEQKKALAAVHKGVRNGAGQALYTSFPWDPGISSSGWTSWKFANATGPRDPIAVAFVFTTPPQSPRALSGSGTTVLDYALNYNGKGFDVDRDGPKIFATGGPYTESAMSFMTPPSATIMPEFVSRRGKMIVVHGAGDPVFSVRDTIDWYEGFQSRHGGSSSDMARLFIVPGMSHGRGGPAADQFDLVDALVDWVEKGIAPDAVTARARGNGAVAADAVNPEVPASWAPGRTRPLCAYPEIPKYRGSGDPEMASSFTCSVP